MRVLLLLLALLLAGLQYTLWLGSGGHREVAGLQQQVATQQAENLRLQERNDALAAEVTEVVVRGAAWETPGRTSGMNTAMPMPAVAFGMADQWVAFASTPPVYTDPAMLMGDMPSWPSRLKAGVCHMSSSAMGRRWPVAGSV